ncbi:MAG: glycyl-radical enzyme activating protein [Desulfobacterales bacterium]
MTEAPDKLVKGSIFSIQKYSVHDGPGIRTIIFLKGCSLRCDWCSNPESQSPHPQLAYNPGKCLTVSKCHCCRGICPQDALSVDAEGKIVRDVEACDDCLECVKGCPTHALNFYGYQITVDAALKKVEEDDCFYSRSGGGMTLSGGEPLMQHRFALALLREARKRSVDTCIETCGNVPWEVLREAAFLLKNIFYDIKCIDGKKHQKCCGAPNETILENLARLNASFPNLPIIVRTAVIPGFNDTEEEIAAIVDFLKDMPDIGYELLTYHRMGAPKYAYLGRPYPMADCGNLPEGHIEALREFARSRRQRHRTAEQERPAQRRR